MKNLKLIILLSMGVMFITGRSFGQANPFINVLPSNSGIVAVGDTIDIMVTIGNSGPVSTIPQAKLRPIIQVPPSVTLLPNASQDGLPAGWTILSNSGSQLRVCNSTDPIPVNTSRIIILKAQGVAVSSPLTFSGNINFGNGTTCAAGPSVAGDLITDNSATSTIQVTTFGLDVIVDAPISCYGMTNGSIQAIPSFAGPTYTFTLNGGVATNTTGFFDMLGPGTYTVCASDGMSSSCNSVTLTEPAQLTASLSIDSTVSCLGNDGAISALVSGGTTTLQPYVLTWSAGVNASSIYATSVNGLAVGTYTVTVEDDNYCFTTATVNLTATSPVVVTASASPIVCFGGTTTIVPNATGGTGAISYSISGGTFTVTAGAYTITATDAKGCTATTTMTISEPTQLIISSVAGSVDCNNTTTTVHISATGGTPPYTGTGAFTVSAGTYTYTVTDANGCIATTSVAINSIPDMTNPTIYLQSSSLLPGVTGPSTTQTPYLLPQTNGAKFTSILSVNDVVGTYRMVGIPDGLGAYDNYDGTFTLLMNHELGATSGIVRAHGSTGAFVSKWVINKSNLAVQSGSDLVQTVFTWNTTSNSFVQGTTQFNRLCSADLPSVSAFYNQATGLGTQERIFLNGEESGAEGRAFGHILTGPSAGVSYQLPYLGRFSWENAVASPASGNKTVAAGMDDATPGQVYFYIGTKTNSGTDIDKAGLNNGKLWGVKVPGLPTELSASAPAPNTPFVLEDLGFVQNTTGATLNTNSVNAGVTNFLRPEDGAFDPSNPNDFYFVTTNSFTTPSRLYRLRFNDITNPETGGTITAVLDGTEGQKMLDNMTIDKLGHILLQEDPGGQAHSAKIWQYTIATDALELVGKHDPARFGDQVGSTTTPATLPFNNDEESSGIIDMSDILGPGMFLVDVQAHYTTGLPNLTEVVQGGQLLAFFNPASVSATASTANDTVFVTTNNCNGVSGVSLGTPSTGDNCGVASLTNNAPSTFPLGNTAVTWTVTDVNGNTNTATQIVSVNYSSTGTTTVTACDSYTWSCNGTTYTTSGTYTCTSLNQFACVHTETLNLTINFSSSTSTTATACDSYTWNQNNVTYTTSGTYVAVGTNAQGCTDTHTLFLTVNYSSTGTTTATACDSYTWSCNGTTYTTSGTYTCTYLNASGCLHTQTLNLSLGYTTYSSQNVTALGSYLWSVNGITYTQSGVYTHTLQNASGCDSILSLNLTIIPAVNLSLKAFLGGAYDPQTGLMQDSLRSKQLIPLTEVYSMAPFNRPQVLFAGGETVSPSLLNVTGPDAIVDWVYIEVRSGANAHQLVATKRALIQRDGDVVDTNGSTSIFLPGLATGQYFVSLKHRNHLGIMTANAITLSQSLVLINFAQPSYPVWVNAMITTNPPRQISGSAAIMIPGDANFNKNVKYNGLSNDKVAVLNVVGAATPNNVVNGYRTEDVNMDGQVKYNSLNNDRSFIGIQIGVANPNLILSQHTPN